jgi:hypothetical protein
MLKYENKKLKPWGKSHLPQAKAQELLIKCNNGIVIRYQQVGLYLSSYLLQQDIKAIAYERHS